MTYRKTRNERKGYRYTKEEIEYIKENYGIINTSTIAMKLGRSEQAIQKKALQIFGSQSGHVAQALFTSVELSEALGVWNGAVAEWIRKRGLPAKRYNKKLTKNAKHGNKFKVDTYGIDIEDFFSWLKNNKENVYIKLEIVDLEALGYAPEWFLEDYKNKVIYSNGKRREWSQEEIDLLLHLFYNEGKKIKEIAEILGRDYGSVRRKKQYLNDRMKGIKQLKKLTKIAI